MVAHRSPRDDALSDLRAHIGVKEAVVDALESQRKFAEAEHLRATVYELRKALAWLEEENVSDKEV